MITKSNEGQNVPVIHRKKPLIKICGNMYLEEAFKVAKYGPDFMGWIFATRSPRRISVDEAKKMILKIKEKYPGIFHVGVFAGNPLQEILMIAKEIKEMDFLQVVEDSNFIHRLRAGLKETGIEIGVVPVIRPVQKLREADFLSTQPSPFWIVDSYDPVLQGGTGKEIPEDFFEEKIAFPFLIAGGIKPENAKRKLEATQAIGIDVSSGVEDSPGKKNEEKLEKLFLTLRTPG